MRALKLVVLCCESNEIYVEELAGQTKVVYLCGDKLHPVQLIDEPRHVRPREV